MTGRDPTTPPTGHLPAARAAPAGMQLLPGWLRRTTAVAVATLLIGAGSLLQPYVTGRASQLHPLVIVSAVSAGAVLGGALGALVAVPRLAGPG